LIPDAELDALDLIDGNFLSSPYNDVTVHHQIFLAFVDDVVFRHDEGIVTLQNLWNPTVFLVLKLNILGLIADCINVLYLFCLAVLELHILVKV